MMTTDLRLALPLAVAVLTGSATQSLPVNLQTPEVINDADVYAVYAAAVRTKFTEEDKSLTVLTLLQETRAGADCLTPGRDKRLPPDWRSVVEGYRRENARVRAIREGFDLAIRIGELQDSSLVARKLASDNRLLCATPGYLEKHGTPGSLADLDMHNCLTTEAQDIWRIEGTEGAVLVRPHGNVRSDSGEFVREAVVAGLGVGLLSTWDIAAELKTGALQVVLPRYRGASNVAVHAVFPSREFMPQ